MKTMTKYKIITFAFPTLIILIYFMQNVLISIMSYVPSCPFYKFYHLYCPACGNTRSVTALLNGNILLSLRYNITPFLFLLFSIGAYIEFASLYFHHPIRILPRNIRFYLIGFILLMIYIIFRNAIPFLTPRI